MADYYSYAYEYPKDDCPDPLRYSNEFGICFFKCRNNFIYSDYQWDIAINTFTIVSVLSVFTSYFYLITSVLRYESHLKFPNICIFWINWSNFVISVAFILNLLLGTEYVICSTNSKPADQQQWACGTQAFLSVYALFCNGLWWTVFNISVILRVTKRDYIYNKKWWINPLLAVVINLIAFIPSITMLSTDNVIASVICFYGPKKQDDLSFILGFYGPLITIITINIVLMMASIIRIIMNTFLKKGYLKQSLKLTIRTHFRLFLLYMYNMTLYIITLLVVSYNFSQVDYLQNEGKDYIDCMNDLYIPKEVREDECNFDHSHVLPWGILYIFTFHFSIGGLIVFVIFSVRKDTFLWFKYYFRHVTLKKTLFPPTLRELIVYSAGDSSGSSSSLGSENQTYKPNIQSMESLEKEMEEKT
eukprot:TRINITY_DN9495_c1_g1_i1.p1 TRINITY_DN9495_c1_g1~~TRINITY_DN9495_c1_g1_i1.p1  ORF type:complete len:450 (-),score=28.07 TRINITY_DN9495_c1_g1_i1:1-1251(-)